ncbi:MAG TPA: hypothetical protein VNI61_01220 [Gemmatimonadales bacterium]|nr:hypothetical protein [Gemmatimonadales bacterium]
MPLPPLYGHEALRSRLARAIASGRLPQALLLEGPRQVGKQRLGLWIAQTLLCQREEGRGEPCGSCRSCRLVVGLSHPDLHWFFPVEVSRKGADADKQVELVEEALAEELERRRARPLYQAPSGLASHGIASVRLLLRRLALTPAMGGMKVFLIGDAERLVPQVGAEQAANALLKALEEPPHDTQFILTAADPEALLPTILSRVVRVRMQRVPDSVVASFVQNEIGSRQPGSPALASVASADGCPGRLIAPDPDGPGERSGGGGGGGGSGSEALLRAARAKPLARYAFALAQKPFEARGAFSDLLDGLLERLRAQARAGGTAGRKGEMAGLVRAISQVMEARELAQGNVNPQLLAAVLIERLSRSS